MKSNVIQEISKSKAIVLIKKCHVCGHIMESSKEPEKCGKCNKSFLPSNYFSKVHAKTSKEFKSLFSQSNELHEDEIIKGLTVIW